ncbi:high-affinity glucose transporter Hxt2p [[Candida] jaroonii]|uniref:High-affinity glucose transporter Hxt2p n=1 Tax=[Candida] jaroonii TaxID=467808 RepID=A0ACA9YC61_9ASCO|nr:high-affinity glucose transporter Hxt2p [[Candida] jaroonii]
MTEYSDSFKSLDSQSLESLYKKPKMRLFKTTPVEEIVGPAIAEVLPDHGKPWYKVKHILRLNLIILIPLLSAAVAGFDGSLLNGSFSLTQWKNDFDNPTGNMLGLIGGAQQIGCVIILPVCGWCSDYLGRKKTLYIGLVGVIIATIIQATAFGVAQLVVSRIIVGAAGMLVVQPAPLLLAELAYPSLRGKITALYWCFYYLGAILASWSCFGTRNYQSSWSWRIPTILQAAYPIIQLCFLHFVPESPRWLIMKGKYEKARDILIEHHAGGDVNSRLVEVELTEIVAAIEVDKISNKAKWSDLVATPGNRKRTYIAVTLGVFAQWNGIAVVSYYLSLILDSVGITSVTMQTLINGILQIFNLFAAAGGALLVDNLGRRKLLLTSGGGMLISFVIWTALSANFEQTGSGGSGKAVVAFIFIFYGFYDVAMTSLLFAYPSEISTTLIRSKIVSVELFSIYAALVVANFCNPIALDSIHWKYYLVFVVVLALGTANIYFFYPETKGYSLEEISKIFDGEESSLEVTSSDALKSNELKAETHHVENSKDLV